MYLKINKSSRPFDHAILSGTCICYGESIQVLCIVQVNAYVTKHKLVHKILTNKHYFIRFLTIQKRQHFYLIKKNVRLVDKNSTRHNRSRNRKMRKCMTSTSSLIKLFPLILTSLKDKLANSIQKNLYFKKK